jgi:two-component system nitrogen regulation sensor histidine kinase NtrY
MGYKHYRLIFWIRMVFILATTVLVVLSFPKTLSMAPVLLIALLIIQMVTLLSYLERPQRDINRFFDAIRYSDFMQTFSDKSIDKSLTPMKEAFTKVMESFQKARTEKEAQYRYLQTVVQHIGIGILVFKTDGQIDMMNRAARKLLGIPSLKNLDALTKVSTSLPDTIRHIQPGEKTHIQFQHAESGDLITLSILTARFIIQNEIYTLVSLQNIQSELDAKELDAWQNLIRVLTHEIMNSITPIVSLASTAKNILEIQESEDSENLRDVDQAIQTIQTRSEGLLRFVKSYRQLTHMPQPSFSIVAVSDLLSHIYQLLKPDFDEKKVEFAFNVSPSSLEITADRHLIEQVLINLLQNALYWCSRKSGGAVKMIAELGPGSRPVIRVIDNGPGIQKKVLEKIFIPFFTTKEDGSGIGLSLSRQIMQVHKGHITVQSVPSRETVFTLKF